MKILNRSLFLDLSNITSLLFYLFPIFFILGSALINIYFIILFLLCFIWFIQNRKKFYFILLSYEKIFLIFICYLFISNLLILNFNSFLKIIYFTIFLFILIIFRYLKPNINFQKKNEYFLIIFFLFLSIDAIVQFIFGVNFFGIKNPSDARISGIFGDESILGSFLSKFLIIIVAILLNYFNKWFSGPVKIFYLLIFIFIIFLSGERISFISGMFFLFIFLLYVKKYKLITFYFFISLILILTLLKSSHLKDYKNRYLLFIADLGIVLNLPEKYLSTQEFIDEQHKIYIKKNNTQSDEFIAMRLGISKEKVLILRNNEKIKYNFLSSFHGGLYANTIRLFKEKKFFGHGIKNYRQVCKNPQNPQYFSYNENIYKYHCSSHPHNIYLELLVETGLVGTLIFIIFTIVYIFQIKINRNDLIQSALFITIISLFFPLIATGSIFSSKFFIYYLFFIVYLNNHKKL